MFQEHGDIICRSDKRRRRMETKMMLTEGDAYILSHMLNSEQTFKQNLRAEQDFLLR